MNGVKGGEVNNKDKLVLNVGHLKVQLNSFIQHATLRRI